jgi:hypothetical protein
VKRRLQRREQYLAARGLEDEVAVLAMWITGEVCGGDRGCADNGS